MGSRRLRGLVLRLAYHQKFALVFGATGMALVFMALSGRQSDWEE